MLLTSADTGIRMESMKLFKCILLFVVGAVLAGVLIIFVLLIAMPDVRRQAFSSVVPAYNLYQTMYLRRFVRERDFSAAAERLNQHIDLSLQMSSSRSPMVPGLVKAFEFVVEQARFENEFEILKRPLERLVKIEPELFLGRIWLARAMWYDNPEASMHHLKTAASLVSADERSYRQGIEAALKLGKLALAQAYCKEYQTAQFGGPKPRGYNHLYRGLGLRRMGLVSKTKDGQEIVVTNSGLELNQRRSYSFSLPNPESIDRVELHLGTLPGLEITLHEILLVSPDGPVSYQPTEVLVTTRSAYISSHGEQEFRIITTNDDDEVLRFRFPRMHEDIGRVSINLTFRRLKLASGDICKVVQ